MVSKFQLWPKERNCGFKLQRLVTRRVARLSLRKSLKSLDIQREHEVELLLFYVKAEVLQKSDYDGPWEAPFGDPELMGGIT